MAKASELNIVEDFEKSVDKIKEKMLVLDMKIKSIETSSTYKKYKDQGYDIDAISSMDQDDSELSEDTKELLKYADIAKEVEQYTKEKEELTKKMDAQKNVMKATIKKYITNSEKELKKAEKAKADFEKYVDQQKTEKEAKIATLIEEIANEENESIKSAKQREKDNLEDELKSMDSDIKEYTNKIESLKTEIAQVKDKYKDYLELEDEAKKKEESKEQENVVTEEPGNIEAPEENEKQEVEDKQNEVSPVIEETQEEVIGSTETKNKTDNAKKEVESEVQEETVAEKEEAPKAVEEEKETDEEAFNRISKKLLNRKTRHGLTYKEFDKMAEILSNSDNFEKLGINTGRFLGFIPSKADRIYKQMGRIMSYQINQDIRDKKLLEGLDAKELLSLRNIDRFGADKEQISKSEEIIARALANAEEKDMPRLVELRNRMQSFRNSIETLASVRVERGEAILTKTNELPEAKPEPEEVEVKPDALSKLQEQVMEEPAPLPAEFTTDDKEKAKANEEMEEI